MPYTDQELLDQAARAAQAATPKGKTSAGASVAPYTAAAASVGGPVGATVAAVVQVTASVFDTFKNIFTSPSPDWIQTNTIATPTAVELTKRIIDGVGEKPIPDIVLWYAEKLKAYIKNSPHNPTQTQNFINAVDTEVLGKSGGFRVDAFPFDVVAQEQLAWAIWLHAHWLYGGVSRDEIVNGNALRKFNESLVPTLQTAIYEGTGTVVNVTETKTPTSTKTTTVNSASLFGSPMNIVLIGAAVGLLWFAAKGKY